VKICILGATGLVGHELLELIPRAWPGATVALFASRPRAIEVGGTRHEVRAATDLEAADAPRGDLAMVALDDDHSRRYVPRLLELGYRVVDKSNTFRMDPRIPLVVAGVNHGRVDGDTPLVANPNCTTIPFCLAVAPLRRAFGLEAATVSTYQAISGAGLSTLEEFVAESGRGFSAAAGAGALLGTTFAATGYAGNTVPHHGKTDDSGFSSEERKLVDEGHKILEDDTIGLCAQACRVPVAVGHYENAWVTLGRAATLDEVVAELESDRAPFVRLLPGPSGEGLSALRCLEHRDETLVGRLRRDPRDGRTICLTIVADNLRLGAATNAVRIASRWFPSRDATLQV
jgi:aspartate-semialdehyde dehydrogenase